jgi:hypothetical protein
MLFFHCKEVQGIKNWNNVMWKKTLVCFVCPTVGDNPYSLVKAVKEITRSLGYLKENNVVLVPFLYLDEHPTNPSDAIWDIKKMENELQEEGKNVAIFEYDSATEFSIDLFGHKVAASFREV